LLRASSNARFWASHDAASGMDGITSLRHHRQRQAAGQPRARKSSAAITSRERRRFLFSACRQSRRPRSKKCVSGVRDGSGDALRIGEAGLYHGRYSRNVLQRSGDFARLNAAAPSLSWHGFDFLIFVHATG